MRVRQFVGALAAGALIWTGGIVGAQHALAVDNDSQIVHQWHTWASPTYVPGLNKTKDQGATASEIGWDQQYVGPGQIAPKCGQTNQQDYYVGTQADIDAIISDGLLKGPNPPEDAAIVKDWAFVSGAPCVTPTPTPTPTVEPTPTPEPTVTPEPSPTPSQHTAEPTPSPTSTPPTVTSVHRERNVDCDLGVAIVITEWLYSDGTSRTLTEQEPLSPKEKKACPTNSAPTPTPTTKPSGTPSAQPTPSPSRTSVPPKPSSPGSPTSTPHSVPTPPQNLTTPSLAETGTDGVVWFVVSLGLLGLGSALVLMNRRKNDGY